MTLDHADVLEHLQNLADELAAEQGYIDILAHPETIVDAPDLFDGTPSTTSAEPLVTVDGNTASLDRPAGGWRSLTELIREHPEGVQLRLPGRRGRVRPRLPLLRQPCRGVPLRLMTCDLVLMFALLIIARLVYPG